MTTCPLCGGERIAINGRGQCDSCRLPTEHWPRIAALVELERVILRQTRQHASEMERLGKEFDKRSDHA